MSALVAADGDRFEARRATGSDGLLALFNEAGVLAPADVHVARRLIELADERDELVALAIGLAVRAPRLGHVFVDLETIQHTASVESDEPADLSRLPWPAPSSWRSALGDSALVAIGEDDPRSGRPLRLLGSWLYLDRYWREECRVAGDLTALAERALAEVDVDLLSSGLRRLFSAGSDAQQVAAAAAVLRPFAVVAGGPGTGKTTTVARIVALLAEQTRAAGWRPPLVALAAPTGKAAARLAEAVAREAEELAIDNAVRRLLLELQASTLHRLLGWRPGSHSRFAHDRDNRLPHDVVIVDETSMISLSLMSRLVEAVRPDARLILVGDPGQLTSIEAGVVLGDIVGPAASNLQMTSAMRDRLAAVTGVAVQAEEPPAGNTIGDGIVVLDRVYRYGGVIAALADAVRVGDADEAMAVLRGEALPGGKAVTVPLEETDAIITWAAEDSPEVVREQSVRTGRAVVEAARAGDARAALDALGGFRLLCANRRGPYGVSHWTARQQTWLATEVNDLDLEQRDYVGRPLLVTENDYELGLFNGDTGVIVRDPETGLASAVFERGGALLSFSPYRLAAVETVYAMTIHKSQGSQFDTAAVLLPPASAPILTRELLYTAITRARRRLILVGSEDAVRSAIERPVSRASGLRARLWR